MDHWYSVSLGDGVIAGGPAAEIEDRFASLFTAAGKPADMAVFTRPESEDRLYCEVIAYFSPAAAEVAATFGGRPCVRPARAGLQLLAGDEQSWAILFPESGI